MTNNNPAAKIIALPSRFSLLGELRRAKSVTFVMASAKRSGWNEIERELLVGTARIDILVGLNFGITEPAVLSDWLKLQSKIPHRFKVSIAPDNPVFHPKVILVERENGSRFAIVGSGNLTSGGFSRNIECGAMITTRSHIEELVAWRSALVGVSLNKAIIDRYRPLYGAQKKAAKASGRSSTALKRLLNTAHRSTFEGVSPKWHADRFLRDFRQYCETPEGKHDLQNRARGAHEIRRLLQFPSFNFTKQDWYDFYRVPEFGRIRQSYKTMANKLARLQNALRILTSLDLSVEQLEEILAINGKYHVRGLGTNLISKILTVHKRRQWPVFNSRVEQTFAQYGYKVDWGALHYITFSSVMRELRSQESLLDFWALDAFCERKTRKMRT